MTSRSRQAELDLARRAIAHAERRAAEQAAGDDVAERLRLAADPEGRLTVADALAALAREQPGPVNPLAEAVARRRSEPTPAWRTATQPNPAIQPHDRHLPTHRPPPSPSDPTVRDQGGDPERDPLRDRRGRERREKLD